MAWVYLIGEGFFGLIAREFAPLADRLTSLAARRRAPAGGARCGTRALVGARRAPGRPAPHREGARAVAWADRRSWTRPSSAAEAAADADAAVAAVLPRLRAARDVAGAALATFESHLRDVVLPATDGEGRLGPELFAREDDPHDAGSGADARADPRAGRARVRRGPGRDDPDRPRDRAARGSAGRACPGRRRRRRPGGPRRDRRRASRARRAARLLPRGARRASRRSAASATCRAGRRAARDPLDARVPAGVRRRDARARRDRSSRARRRSSRSPRSPDDWTPEQAGVHPPRGQRPDAPAPHDPRGGARPLPPGRVREPQRRRSPGRSSGAASSPRAGRST